MPGGVQCETAESVWRRSAGFYAPQSRAREPEMVVPHDPNGIWARLQRLDRRAVCRPPISASSQYRAPAPERTGPAFLRKGERHGSEYVGTTTESNQRR